MTVPLPPTQPTDVALPSSGLARIIRTDLTAFLVPALKTDLPRQNNASHSFHQAHEQVLTTLLRIGALLGLLTLAINAPSRLQNDPIEVFLTNACVVGLVWVVALARRLDYRLRCGVIMLGLYGISLAELFRFGFSPNSHIYLAAFSLFALLFFSRNTKIGAGALALSIATIAAVGWQLHTGALTPPGRPAGGMPISTIVSTCLIFVMVVGSVQVGIGSLFHHLYAAWQLERDAHAMLQHERDQLEQRVAERTSELAQAHAQAMAATRSEAEQKEYLAVLHQTALELFGRQNVSELLQTIVDRAAVILDTPYSELMLQENGELVVHAFTANQAFLAGDRVSREQAKLSWQAYDTGEPVVLEDYSAWSNRRPLYTEVPLYAVADFPIMAGSQPLGVLAMGRGQPGHHFTAEDIEKGMAFSRMAALVLDNAHLYSTAIHEIAERKAAEQALQRYAEELEAHNAELDAFAHTVAHDLKTPLTGIIGYNQLLQLGYNTMAPEETQKILEKTTRLGGKMATIINELLLLASTRAREAIPLEPLAMDTIILDVESRLAESMLASGASIVKPARWPAAIGYAPWIEEAWANYISNAIKYGGSPPQIVLGADETADGFVRFWVRDNGPGLDKAEQARLFTPFTRLQTERVEGHGLGLSIVQRIISRLGGEVGVQSEVGGGSTFFFTLPAPVDSSAASFPVAASP